MMILVVLLSAAVTPSPVERRVSVMVKVSSSSNKVSSMIETFRHWTSAFVELMGKVKLISIEV